MTNSFAEELWDPIKIYKKDYVPEHTKLRNLEGQLVNDKQRPYTLADYFEQVQLKNERQEPKLQGIKTTPFFDEPASVDTEEVSEEEIREIIKSLKNNMTPGPDRVTSEIIKMLDREIILIILRIVNGCVEK